MRALWAPGILASWFHPEVFQHRLAAVLCTGFAAIQVRVTRKRSNDRYVALVFPILCELGEAF